MEEPSIEEIIAALREHQQVPLYPGTEFDDCAICSLVEFVRETYL